MRIFLAGIMQGSHVAAVLHNQSYRRRLRELLARCWPNCEVYDPLADHGGSLDYDDQRAREVFHRHNRLCGEVDLVIAFVPEATMGTAIEMYEAHRRGRLVVAVSPLKHNWAVKFCSDRLYETVDEFETAIESGELLAELKQLRQGRHGKSASDEAIAGKS